MKLEKGNDYKISDFTANELGFALKDGVQCEYNGMPVFAHGKAPEQAKPGQGYFGKTGLCSYTATGKQMGAKEGSTRETRKINYTIPLAIFAENANPFTPIPEGESDDIKKTVRVENASKFLGMLFGDSTIDVPGREAGEEFHEWESLEEVEAAAGKALGKKTVTKAENFAFMKTNPQKRVAIPAIPASKTTMRALLKSVGPNGKVELAPAQVGALRTAIMEKVSDAVRLVSDATEGVEN